jgi:hypothetical protein
MGIAELPVVVSALGISSSGVMRIFCRTGCERELERLDLERLVTDGKTTLYRDERIRDTLVLMHQRLIAEEHFSLLLFSHSLQLNSMCQYSGQSTLASPKELEAFNYKGRLVNL